MDNRHEFLTAKDIAPRLGVKPARVYQLFDEGILPCIKRGRWVRVSRGAFEAWLQGCTATALMNVRKDPVELPSKKDPVELPPKKDPNTRKYISDLLAEIDSLRERVTKLEQQQTWRYFMADPEDENESPFDIEIEIKTPELSPRLKRALLNLTLAAIRQHEEKQAKKTEPQPQDELAPTDEGDDHI